MLPCAAPPPCRHKHGVHAPGVPREDGAGLGASPGGHSPALSHPCPPPRHQVCVHIQGLVGSELRHRPYRDPSHPPQRGPQSQVDAWGRRGQGWLEEVGGVRTKSQTSQSWGRDGQGCILYLVKADVCVSQGCHIKQPQTRGLRQQKGILSVWRPEV